MQQVRLARTEHAGLEAAVAEVWPEVPGPDAVVALLAMPVGPQGEASQHAVSTELIGAAARHLASAGARVELVVAPGRLEHADLLEQRLAEVARAGVVVGSADDYQRVDVAGQVVAAADLIQLAAAADVVALLASVAPHQLLRVASVELAVSLALHPNAREWLFRCVTRPEDLLVALDDLAGALGPRLVMADLGPDLGALIGGEDVAAVAEMARRVKGLAPSSQPIDALGVAPELVARASQSARDRLPEGPGRYPGADRKLCTACGVCTEVCPTAAVTLPKGAGVVAFDYAGCIRCGSCIAACPEFALTTSVQPRVLGLRRPQGLVLDAGPLEDPRADAIPIAAAMALAAAAIDPPPRRPAWLTDYVPPTRFEGGSVLGRQRLSRTRLPADGRPRVIVVPVVGRPSVDVACLAAALGPGAHVVDLAAELRALDPRLDEALRRVGYPDPSGGTYGPALPLAIEATDPAPRGDTLARQVHEAASRDAVRLGASEGTTFVLALSLPQLTYGMALGSACRAAGARVLMLTDALRSEALEAGAADAVLASGHDAGAVAWVFGQAPDFLPAGDWRGQHLSGALLPVPIVRGERREAVAVAVELLGRTCAAGCQLRGDMAAEPDWLNALCEELLAEPARPRWEGTANGWIAPTLLARARAAGCARLHIDGPALAGPEAGPTEEMLERALQLGFDVRYVLRVGRPGESERDVDASITAASRLMARYDRLDVDLRAFSYLAGELPARGALPVPVDRDVVVGRLNRASWAMFGARMPEKIPILNEELPFCNDNCVHCGVADIMKTANVVPYAQVAKSLAELAPRSGGRVMFAVSELTIRPDFVKIVKTARRVGMKTVALVTNARMFSYPRFAEKAIAAGITHALVSVYGPTPRLHEGMTRTPGSFEQTIAGLEALLAAPSVTVMSNTVITKKNYRYLPQLVELLAGLGVKNVNLSFVQIIGAAARYQRAIVPRVAEVLADLQAAVDLGVALGLNMGIGGLPYCVLKGYENHFGVDDLTYVYNGDEADNITSRSPYARADACVGCAYNAVCLGMQKEYLEQFGDGELDPYPGPRLTRRPASEIVRAMFPDLQLTRFGRPSSLFAPKGAEARAAARVGG